MDLLLSGKSYLEWTRLGYVFSARSTVAAVLPVTATTGNAPALWNPSSSGKIVVPMFLRLTKHTPGTAASGGCVLGYKELCGDDIATAGAVVTWTNVAPISCLLGSGKTPRTKFSPAVSTYTAAPTLFMDIGLSYNMSTAVANDAMRADFDFKGSVILKPGAILSVHGMPVSVATYTVDIIFAEFAMPGDMQ
jgi:hypothetical protein